MDDRLRRSRQWKDGKYFDGVDTSVFPLSFSGHERNHLFVNQRGQRFTDTSGLSGLDSPSDGRGFALCDYDHDGWADIAVVNANAPWLTLYRNQLQNCRPDHAFVAVRLEGGNHTDQPTNQWSNRDGYGARIRLDLENNDRIVREHRCGEGFASQNSTTLLIGIGPRSQVERLTVRWPSGKQQQLGPVPAGSLLTVYENPADSPDGTGYHVRPYRSDAVVPSAAFATVPVVPQSLAQLRFAPFEPSADAPEHSTPALRLYTSMATWCAACLKHLPQFDALRRAFPPQQLGLLAVPIDPNDTPEMLRDYLNQHGPSYQLLLEWPLEQREGFQQLLTEALGTDVIPSAVVVDRRGRIVWASTGLPSVSDVRRLLTASAAPTN